MSALSRFGPIVAKSLIAQQQRQMASAAVASDPIQNLFLDKIREAKTSNKGLDAAHERQLKDEMLRLKRVYAIEDENKLAQLDHKFDKEYNVSLHDIDSNAEKRSKIASGEYQKQLSKAAVKPSAILATIPDQTPHDLALPVMNKPDFNCIYSNRGVPKPPTIGETIADYESEGGKMTAERLERELAVKFGDDMPTIHEGPERDLVNFPRYVRTDDTPPTRYHIIPESWFQFFYPKTGVTGPYAFVAAFGSFLLSKEWLVMEHELLTGISSTVIIAYAVTKYGPKVREWLVKEVKKDFDGWHEWQHGHISTLNHLIDHYKQQFECKETIDQLYEARNKDVELQLEAEYRRRIQAVYDDTKRRLNYLVAVADTQRQIHHSNLVNAVISSVLSSLGPKQEAEVLDNCIVNLKSMASKHANAI